MNLQIVTADLYHSRVIWEWRNDPLARAISRSQEFISWENHSNWYEKFLLNPKHVMYVGLNGKLPFGMVRFDSIDNSENSFKISININSSERGKGLGIKILKLALNKLKQEKPSVKRIIADVKKENLASNRLFKSADFVPKQSNESEFNSYCFAYNP